jgi:hypothetical protein
MRDGLQEADQAKSPISDVSIQDIRIIDTISLHGTACPGSSYMHRQQPRGLTGGRLHAFCDGRGHPSPFHPISYVVSATAKHYDHYVRLAF